MKAAGKAAEKANEWTLRKDYFVKLDFSRFFRLHKIKYSNAEMFLSFKCSFKVALFVYFTFFPMTTDFTTRLVLWCKFNALEVTHVQSYPE